MIVILKPQPNTEKLVELLHFFESMGLQYECNAGTQVTVITLIGDTIWVDMDAIRAWDIVADVKRISQPYKLTSRLFHPEDTVVRVGDVRVGGGFFSVIAGPCCVESEEQILCVAEEVKKHGATMLRGGAFKPRTSPYAFQGLQAEGLSLLLKAKRATGLPIVTEIVQISHLELFADVDMIQVGARNMQNFALLKELGHCQKPILLKRGSTNTLEELLMSAEYILAGGNTQVILCERGIRSFEPMTRHTLDISAIPLLHHLSHLPVIVDPSHAGGIPWLVEPLCQAAVAAGVDGLMIEVHNDPCNAQCDAAQALMPDRFGAVMAKVTQQRALGKALEKANKRLTH